MKHILLTIAVVSICYQMPAKQNKNARQNNTLNNIVNTVTGAVGNGSGGNTGNIVGNLLNNAGKPLTNDQIIQGLRDALKVGTNNSTAKASAVDGFYKNAAIKIPFPQQAIQMKQTLDELGMKPATDKFVETLNRAAEKAAKDAAPIFINAIVGMSITDGISILKGQNDEATRYLKGKTTNDLKAKFLPVVKKALLDVQITKYWGPLANKYNKIPLVQKVNPNLEDYVTTKAIEGLFKLIAAEESKIRKDPASRITDLLKLVFG
jgi:hypothetical protein